MRNLEIKNNDCHAALAMTKSVQSGRSMIEMLGVLAIIGVLSVGGIAGYSKAMMKYRINKTIEQITLVAGNVRAFWGPQKNYIGVHCASNNDGTCDASGCWGQSDGDGCPIVKKAKIFPDEMITVTDGKIMSITNPFGYGVISTGSSEHFIIKYYIPLDYEVCIELMSHDWTAAGVKGILLVGPNLYSAMMPISIETAVDKCSSWIKTYTSTAPSAKSGSMAFYFDLKNNCTFNGPNVVCS